MQVSFLSMLAIVFIALKLAGVIYWSWWAVLSPIWVPWVVFLIVIAVCSLFSAVFGK